jgi:hypothetical protein
MGTLDGIPQTKSHFYCGVMNEAISSIVLAHKTDAEAERQIADGDNSCGPMDLKSSAGVLSRYSFFTALAAFEAGGNALLEGIRGVSSSLVDELDRLSTPTKYELFALCNGTPLDRSVDHFAKMMQIVRLRNAFVHPKDVSIDLIAEADGSYSVKQRTVGNRTYPPALEFLELRHSLDIVGDILRFVSWVLFDTCSLAIADGADILNRKFRSHSGDVFFANETFGYDIRSFGISA